MYQREYQSTSTRSNNDPINHSIAPSSQVTTTKKALKRKPPPGIEIPEINTPNSGQIQSEQPLPPLPPTKTSSVSTPPSKILPALPARPNRSTTEGGSTTFLNPVNPSNKKPTMNLKVNTSPDIHQYKQQQLKQQQLQQQQQFQKLQYQQQQQQYQQYQQQYQHQQLPQRQYPPYNDQTHNDTYDAYDYDTYFHYESPKPMGPKELPGYDDFDPPHSNKQYQDSPSSQNSQSSRSRPARKFQGLSNKASRSPIGPLPIDNINVLNGPTPPYPSQSYDADLDIIATYNDDYDDQAYDFFNPDLTPSKVKFDFNSDGSHLNSSPITRRYSHSGSPSRIPPLNDDNLLSLPDGSTVLKPQKSMPALRSDDHSNNNSKSPTNRRHGIAKFGGSTKSTPSLNIPLNNQDIDQFGSKPSSPKKYYGRSPSLNYTSPFNDYQYQHNDSDLPPSPSPTTGESYYDNYYSQYYAPDSNEIQEVSYDDEFEKSERPSRWSSIESSETQKTDISDYYDNINIGTGQINSATTSSSYANNKIYSPDYGKTETPINSYFDYSILPDLPSASSNDSNNGPQRHLTMNSAVSAISFLKNNLLNDETNNQAALKKKKDDELPPVPLDLPSLPFSSSSLVTQHFSTCERVWSLSSVFEWCLNLKVWLHDSFISKREFKKALIKLIVFHKRDVPLDLIGQNADRIIDELLKSKAIFYCYGVEDNEDDEKSLPDPATGEVSTSKVSTSPDNVALASKDEPGILMDDSAYVSGVMVDLTDCYCHDRDHNYASGRQQNQTSNENHNENVQKRCYSFNCNLNRLIEHELQLKNTNIHEIVLGEDWASHWKLTAEDLRNFDKNVSKRQSLIFDLLRYEQTFIQRATCFVEIVGPEFIKIAQLLVGPEIVSINKFEDDMISPGKELVGIHEKSLFHPLLRILISNGKFISNLSEIANIYYNWSQVVKNSLLKYISTVPMIEDLLKYELIKNWVDHNVRNISRVKELKVNGPLLFMSTFNSRYQSLPLQLSDIRKSFDSQDPEYIALTRAIDGIKKLGSKVNEMKVHADNIHALKRVYKQLTWKSSIQQPNINLGSENRRFLFRGDLSRKGDLKINTYINHLILLDNYLFITEKIKNPRSGGYNYKVVENPIPIELLLFEIKENQTLATSGGIEISLSKTLNLNPSTSPKSPNPVLPENEDEPSSFPIKLRYAGRGKHDSFTFSAKTERERMDWVNQLISARSSLCSRLKKTEPYNLNLISNTNFAYEFSNRITKLQVCAPHDPIESISTDAFTRLAKLGCNGDAYSLNNSRNHIIFSKAQSVSKFEYRGTEFYLVGLVNGVYLSDMQNRWKKVINGVDITKISVVTSINLVVILGNKQLRYYTLDSIINVYYERRDSMSSISLSNEPVSFYEIGRHREITMLFYAKRKGNSSGTTNFKVLIPETDNDGVFNAFKVVKKFYVEAECFGLSIFNTSFAVHTHKGFEILELDKLIPRSIPEIPNVDSKKTDAYGRRLLQNGTNMSMATSTSITASSSHPGIDAIKRAMHASSIKPMGMFKLTNNAEFLLVYNDYAIFTNKHGKLSRFTMLKFDFKAKSIAFKNNNLFLVCDEAIEIWSISDFVNGSNRLIQVIVGKDINMLDSNDLSFAMANPKVVGLQLIFRLDNVSTEVENSLT